MKIVQCPFEACGLCPSSLILTNRSKAFADFPAKATFSCEAYFRCLGCVLISREGTLPLGLQFEMSFNLQRIQEMTRKDVFSINRKKKIPFYFACAFQRRGSGRNNIREGHHHQSKINLNKKACVHNTWRVNKLQIDEDYFYPVCSTIYLLRT